MTDPDARARFVGLNHVALPVGDVDAALEWYGDLFAFDCRGRSETAAFLDAGDQFLAVSAVDDSTGASDEHRHVGIVVDDADLVERRVEAADLDRLETPGLDVRDPWGNRLQIVEYGAVQFTKAAHVLDGMGLAALEKTDDALAELEENGLAPED